MGFDHDLFGGKNHSHVHSEGEHLQDRKHQRDIGSQTTVGLFFFHLQESSKGGEDKKATAQQAFAAFGFWNRHGSYETWTK